MRRGRAVRLMEDSLAIVVSVERVERIWSIFVITNVRIRSINFQSLGMNHEVVSGICYFCGILCFKKKIVPLSRVHYDKVNYSWLHKMSICCEIVLVNWEMIGKQALCPNQSKSVIIITWWVFTLMFWLHICACTKNKLQYGYQC